MVELSVQVAPHTKVVVTENGPKLVHVDGYVRSGQPAATAFDYTNAPVHASEDYFNVLPDSFYDELEEMNISDVTMEDSKAVEVYAGMGFFDINQTLRAYEEPPLVETGLKPLVEHLDSAIASNTLPRPVVAARGVWEDDDEVFSSLKPGDTFSDKAYVSTTLGPMSRIYPEERPAITLSIHIPEGANALFLDENLSENWDELELLLPRDSKFKVLSREDDADGYSTIEMELVT
jgi:hypothetical protein